MKKTFLPLAGTMALATLLLSAGVQVFAEEVANTTSQAAISWTDEGESGGEEGGGTPINPIGPPGPGEVTPPEGGGDGDGEGTTGPLRIDYVTGISFGEHAVSGSEQTYSAAYKEFSKDGEPVFLPTFVQVTDNRGTNGGWNLTVENTPFINTEDKDDVLEGAVLTLGANKKVYAKNINGKEYTAVASAATLTGSNTASEVATAAEEKGMGVNTILFGEDTYGDAESLNDAVTLTVPGVAHKTKDAKYVSTLTWTLSDAEV